MWKLEFWAMHWLDTKICFCSCFVWCLVSQFFFARRSLEVPPHPQKEVMFVAIFMLSFSPRVNLLVDGHIAFVVW
jgi:hypothetical protein